MKKEAVKGGDAPYPLLVLTNVHSNPASLIALVISSSRMYRLLFASVTLHNTCSADYVIGLEMALCQTIKRESHHSGKVERRYIHTIGSFVAKYW